MLCVPDVATASRAAAASLSELVGSTAMARAMLAPEACMCLSSSRWPGSST